MEHIYVLCGRYFFIIDNQINILIMSEPKCVAGCKSFYGGEMKHHKDCPYYPESLSKMYDDLKEKQQKEKETIMSIIGHGDPYPLETVLEKLKWATEYLLHEKNYDGHCHEELGQSVRRAKEILSVLNTREAHFL